MSGNARRLYLELIAATVAISLGLALAVQPANAQSLKTLKERFDSSLKAGKFDEAEQLARRSMAVAKKRHGRNHVLYGVSEFDLGRALNQQYRYREAIPVLRDALRVLEPKMGGTVNVALVLDQLAYALNAQQELAEAVKYFKQTIDIYQAKLGPAHPNVLRTQHQMALALARQGRNAEAVALLKRVIDVEEKTLGPADTWVAISNETLANTYRAQGLYDLAVRHFEAALNIYKKQRGADDQTVGSVLNNMANVYLEQGLLAKAAGLYNKALAIYDKAQPPNNLAIGNTLNNLANAYKGLGRVADAVPLYERAIALKEKVLGADHPIVADSRNNLGDLYRNEKQYAKAEPLLTASLKIYEKKLGPAHPRVAVALDNLGLLYFGEKQYEKAARFHGRALEIRRKALGDQHPDVGTSLGNQANAYLLMERYADAIPLYKEALAIDEHTFGKAHFKNAIVLDALARTNFKMGRYDQSLAMARQASQALTESRRRATAGQPIVDAGTKTPARNIYERHVQMAYEVAYRNTPRAAALGDEALAAAQRYNTSSVSAALSQMAARSGTGDEALARLVRRQQDLTGERKKFDEALIQALSAPADKRDTRAMQQIRDARADVEKKQDRIAAELDQRFPQYGELTNPAPLPIAEVRRLLDPDEALVFYLVADSEVFVWAINSDNFRWASLGKTLNAETLGARIAEFRKGLGIEFAGGSDAQRFNLETAYRLYGEILAPVEDMIRDKKNLLIVPTGVLTSLPFNVLVTEKPSDAVPSTGEGYRQAAWLVKRYAITILPSVSSLKALRVFASKGRASNPFIGFGDPVFGQDPSGSSRSAKKPAAMQNFRAYFNGARANRDALIAALPPLPGTAIELKAVAKSLGVPDSDVRLGKAASETAVKELKLDQYRIVYFATHGLVAGETAQVASFAEPSLALTIPSAVSDEDDGLLTASEIAQLKLNADWVVLSACNTAAGDKPGAEALSGLAKAFAYAGARALLVSHWPVGDEAAARLTSDTFARLQKDSKLGRAEALRQSMLAMIEDDAKPANAYPAFWAPFIIVGDGGR